MDFGTAEPRDDVTASTARRFVFGPVTQSRIVRSATGYLTVFVIGCALAQGSQQAGWNAFGLGLMWPGAGFLCQGDSSSEGVWLLRGGLAGLAALSFVAAVAAWFATGNILLPAAVWFVAALTSATWQDGVCGPASLWAVPLALFLGGVAAGCGVMLYRVRALKIRSSDDAYVAGTEARCAVITTPVDPDEFSFSDLCRMRFLLDRALQPVEAFEGFDWLDQFQTAAVRYQVNFAGYALALAQHNRLPAFDGYLGQAQRNLIDKQRDHRIWRYWALENAWGNLTVDPDPVARDNIMYSGFCATQIALYHAASGKRCFDTPASFRLRHPCGAEYDYDLESLVAAVARGWSESRFGLMPCEPNWIYPLCNAIGATALVSRDAQAGTRFLDMAASSYRRGLEREFTTLSGRLIPFRSSLTGFAAPRVGGALADAFICLFLNTHLRDVARRHWLLARRDMIGEEGLMCRKFWPVDVGNYRWSRAASYAGVAAVAAEMGDPELRDRVLEALQEECPDVVVGGVAHRPKASVWAHGVEFIARAGGADAFRSIVHKPQNNDDGPIIDEAPYPNVLVARAVAGSGALQAVFHPGGGPARQCIRLRGLRPQWRYRLEGAVINELVADEAGAAQVDIDLYQRLEFNVKPTV